MNTRATSFGRLQNVEHLEVQAKRDQMVAEAWRLQASLGRSSLDFSKCNSVEETQWVRLGGNVQILRALKRGEGDEARAAFSALLAAAPPTGLTSFGGNPELTKQATEPAAPADRAILEALGLDPDLAGCSSESEMRAALAARKGK